MDQRAPGEISAAREQARVFQGGTRRVPQIAQLGKVRKIVRARTAKLITSREIIDDLKRNKMFNVDQALESTPVVRGGDDLDDIATLEVQDPSGNRVELRDVEEGGEDEDVVNYNGCM
jgi:hypothetical protein